MRVPVPTDSLLALTLVGAVMTAGLTVALADPAAVDALRRDAAAVVAPDEPPAPPTAPPAPTTTAQPSVVSDPTTPTRTVTTAADAGPARSVVAATTSAGTQTPTATPTTAPEPVATPTAVASFTPAVQQPPPGAESEFHEREEHEDGEDD